MALEAVLVVAAAFASASGQRDWPVRRAACRWSAELQLERPVAAGSLARARSSWLRELMASLVKTLPRWYWTVRALMDNRAPISGFDSPTRASRAIMASWAVSASRVAVVRLRAVSPVACSSRLASLGECLDAHRLQLAVGDAHLRPAARRRAQPLPVEQMGAGELRGRGSGQGPVDGLVAALAEQGTRPMPSAHLDGARRAFRQPLERGPGATSPVLAAASASSGTTKGPSPSWSRSNARQAASRAASWRPRPL